MLDQLDTMLFVTIFKLFVNDIFCNLIGKKTLHSAIDVLSVEGKQHLVLNQSDCMLFGTWTMISISKLCKPTLFWVLISINATKTKKYKLRKRILIRSECKMFNFTYSFVKITQMNSF